MPGSAGEEPTAEEREEIAVAASRGVPFLVYRDRGGGQRIYPLPDAGGKVSLGRGSWMDIALAWDERASRLHAQLEQIGDDWTVVDEGLSRNGTFLNGDRVEGRRRLSDGDRLLVGGTEITVHLPAQFDSEQTVVG
jgi:hypothetical protein